MDRIWQEYISEKGKEEYVKKIKSFIKSEIDKGKDIYPSYKNIFNAFEQCRYEKMKVVILGDGPSHLPGIDHGLAFSSLKDSVPSNLVNIYKEVWISFKEEMQQRAGKKEVNFKDLDPNQLFYRADLTQWANQGVLLLNTVLTVEKNKPNSHNGIGWERFVAETLAFISESKDWLVFMLWGENAISYKKYIVCPEKHLILESARPDPLEANKGGWFGNHHFLKGNNFIESKKALTINYFVWEQ